MERAESATQSESEHSFNPLVVAELAAYIVESKRVFPLNELKVLYTTKMKDLGRIVDPKSIHSTRFKEKLLKIEPEIIEASERRGRASMLCSKETAGTAIETELKSQNEVGDNEARMIVQTALFLCKQILFEQKPFDGHFYPDCLRSPIPESLLAFMNVVLQGPTGTRQNDVNNNEPDLNQQRSRVACTLSQLMIFNTAKRTRAGAQMMRHSKERETPFPQYVGLKLHVEGKFKHLINVFEKLGLAITYIREQQVSKCLAAAVSEQIRTNGVVIPSDMRQNVFTTGDMDNIDQHKQSNLSKVEFHGTLITLTNHVSNENPGVVMEPLDISKVDKSQRSRLPDFYTIVPPAELDANNDVILKKTNKPIRPGRDRIESAKAKDKTRINHASDIILNKGSELDDKDKVTWARAGFSSSRMHEDTVKPRAITGVLPMFPDKAASVSMVKHTMCLTRDAIQCKHLF